MEATNTQLCPIPQGVVAYITGANDKERLYVLWKNAEMVVIQASSLLHLAGPTDGNPDTQCNSDFGKMFLYGLEELQTLVHTIEFGEKNWGYLVPNSGRGSEIIQKRRRLPKLTCRTWARLISRREITFTRFWDIDIWNGYWKGQEVDVFMAYDDRSMEALDREMWGYIALQGLDLTYDVLGHVVEDDGTIVGLVFEPYVGRLLEYRDRALAHDALARVQQRGLVYCGAQGYQNFTVMKGKIRLTNLASILPVPDEKRRKESGNVRHWQTLEAWFLALKLQQDTKPRSVIQRCMKQNILLLPRISPERPIFVRFTLGPYKDEDHAKRNDEVLAGLRKGAPSRKRLTFWSKKASSSRNIGSEVARRPEDLRRHDFPRMRASRPYRQHHSPSPQMTLMADTSSDLSSVDYAMALSTGTLSTIPSDPFGRAQTGLPSDCDTESTYCETERLASK